MEKIPDDLGTAANVQAMVFGNLGETSGTGVGFTRNPATGERVFWGEFLLNAQGEDVVAGIRTPLPISDLEKVMPDAYRQLRDITSSLEKHYRDMQDFEFTIENGKLFMLQTRNGKRTGAAALRIAVEMVKEGLIDKKEAVLARRSRSSSINCCIRCLIRPRSRRSPKSPTESMPRPEPQWDALCSPPIKLSKASRKGPSSWSARKPRPTTFTAWKSRQACSPQSAASRATQLWSRAAWDCPAWWARARCISKSTRTSSR